MSTVRRNKPRRIAILGGGCGALAAAFALTADRNWRDQFDVTIYQLGWRLGGKGASGRNLAKDYGARIEEHGLHMWAGFYRNAFQLIHDCYIELDRPTSVPIPTWDAAFSPVNTLCLEERLHGRWYHWPITLTPAPGAPFDQTPLPTISDMLHASLIFLQRHLEGLNLQSTRLLWVAIALFEQCLDQSSHQTEVEFQELANVLSRFRSSSIDELASTQVASCDSRHWRIIVDIICTCSIGILRDGVLLYGFDVIDPWELKTWLRRNGAQNETIGSAIVEGGYDYVFGYQSGDINRPAQAAGVALRGCLRLVFGCRGGILWKMSAGMGDVVFAPLYIVLKNRGVNFNFLHRVEGLDLLSVAGRNSIEQISFSRQAEVKDDAAYDPLIPILTLSNPWLPSRGVRWT